MEKSSKAEEKRVPRIKELMKREGIKQVDLADDLGMEPQNFSRILRTGKVSEKTCKKIVNLYPEYQLEWLLGYSDSMTQTEELKSLIHNKVDSAEALNQLIILTSDDICKREGLQRPFIKFLPDFTEIQSMIRDYTELVISDYLKNRDHSRIWNRIDKNWERISEKSQK